MSLMAIRKKFGVPAKRGAQIEFTDAFGDKFKGVIKSSCEHMLRVELYLNGVQVVLLRTP